MKTSSAKAIVSKIHELGRFSWSGILFVFCLLYFGSSVASPVFLTQINQLNLFRQAAIDGIIASGMTFVLISGGLDLSVGSIFAFVAMLSILAQGHLPLFGIIALCLVAGVLAGMSNGVLVGIVRLDAFLVTLATQLVYRGLTFLITAGQRLSGVNSDYEFFGKGMAGPIPVPIIIFLSLAVASQLLLAKTVFGRMVRYVGANQLASSYSGIRVTSTKIAVFGVSGLMCAISAIVYTSRIGVVYPLFTGDGFEFTAIAASILGGTSLNGGVGSIVGTFMAVMILSLLKNVLNLLNVTPYFHQIISGGIIVVSVLLRDIRKERFR